MKKIFVGIFLFATTILSAADTPKVEWTDKSMFKKNWYEAFSYCEENGARLPTDREADTLENSDIHTVGLNYIKARSSEKKAICVVDHDTNHKNEILLSDIAEIKKACGWDASVKESEADSFDKKTPKIK